MILRHELGEENNGLTFCLAGPLGNGARKMLSPGAQLIWTVEAGSHFEAMITYYEFMGWVSTQRNTNGTISRILKSGRKNRFAG